MHLLKLAWSSSRTDTVAEMVVLKVLLSQGQK